MYLLHKAIQGIAGLCSRNKLPILIYHQVFDTQDEYRQGEPTKEQFHDQMAVLQRYYNPLPLDQAVALLAQKKLPANSICVTFDDGYINNLTVAAPILKHLSIPATVYVASAFTDRENMWNDQIIAMIGDDSITDFDFQLIELGVHLNVDLDKRKQLIELVLGKLKYVTHQERLLVTKQLVVAHGGASELPKMLSAKQLRQLKDYDLSIAAHTHDHPIMAVLPVEQQRQQLQKNRELLAHHDIDTTALGFAYPNGKLGQDYTLETAQLVKEMGFAYAVTTHHGICTPSSDPFQLPRVSPWEKRPLWFHLRLLRNLFG